jgi:hypothetical protein
LLEADVLAEHLRRDLGRVVDIRAGWDNHVEFARENPNFYKLMWSPAVSPNSAAFHEAF